MITTGAFLSAAVGGSPIAGTHEWNVSEVGDKLEQTTGQDGGRGNKGCGVIDTQIKLRFYLDIQAGRAGFIRTGTVLTNLNLFVDLSAANPVYSIGIATVFNVNFSGRVRDQWVVDCDIEANGNVVFYNEPN